LYGQCRTGAQINFPESGRGLGHVTPTIFGSTVGYPSDSLVSCSCIVNRTSLSSYFYRVLAIGFYLIFLL